MTRWGPDVPKQKGGGSALERMAERSAQDTYAYAKDRHKDRLKDAGRRRQLRQRPRGARFGLLRRIVRVIRGGGD